MGLLVALIYTLQGVAVGIVVAWIFGASPFWLIPALMGGAGFFVGAALAGASSGR